MSDSHSPTNELKHFTDREDEQTRFREVLNFAAPDSLPTLNFYGVGGIGKTWLSYRFDGIRAKDFSGVVRAFIDFDTRSKPGAKYANDPSEAWFEIAHQLKIPCPRFVMAYAVMRSKQSDGTLDSHQFTASEAAKLELLGDLAGDSGIPLVGAILRRGFELAAETRLKNNPDFKLLDEMNAAQIYAGLLARLIDDLNDYQPKAPTGQAHSVVFFDTFETLGDATNRNLQSQREEWVRQFARDTKRTLVVTLGRNRLWWDEKPRERYWNQTRNLEQHSIANLSESDARLYLTRCEITDVALQNEVLKDSSCAPDEGYHPWTLGLCGDTLWEMRKERGDGTFPPAHDYYFEDGEHGPAKVVARFLETQSDTRRRWIERLAVTLRFDEAAALHACRAGEDESEAAWERLREFSFLAPGSTGGWYVLHSHMRNQILEILKPERKAKEHRDWRAYWQSRI